MYPDELVRVCQARGVDLQDVVGLFEQVQEKITKLTSHGGIPFDTSLLIMRLDQVVKMYRDS